MRAQVDPRGAHDHHSERLHEDDDRDTGLRAELAVDEIHGTSGDGAGWCVLVRTSTTGFSSLAGSLGSLGTSPAVLEGCGADARALGSAVAAGKDDVKVLVKVRG